MKNYSPWDAREELYVLENTLYEKATVIAQNKDSYELARMVVVINKEMYRYEEEARRLRLTGELDPDVCRELASGYSNIRRRVLDLIAEHRLNGEVSRLFRIMRFSNEVAGLYLTEYLEEIQGVKR